MGEISCGRSRRCAQYIRVLLALQLPRRRVAKRLHAFHDSRSGPEYRPPVSGIIRLVPADFFSDVFFHEQGEDSGLSCRDGTRDEKGQLARPLRACRVFDDSNNNRYHICSCHSRFRFCGSVVCASVIQNRLIKWQKSGLF